MAASWMVPDINASFIPCPGDRVRRIAANIAKLPELLQAYQKRSSLITSGTSHGFALSFAFLSAASHRWRVHSSAAMVSATLNLPCVGQSKPVASPVRGSSCAGELGNGLLHLRRKYLGTTTFWKNSRASVDRR